jgi:DNA-binding NtrC family response regulator
MARLLIVDDELVLADLLKRYLERLGHEVETAESAEKALAGFEKDPRRYELVLADLTLPGMNGEQMLEQMLSRNPSLKAVISSGYPHSPQRKDIAFLQKPYVPKMLADLIAQSVD